MLLTGHMVNTVLVREHKGQPIELRNTNHKCYKHTHGGMNKHGLAVLKNWKCQEIYDIHCVEIRDVQVQKPFSTFQTNDIMRL